VSDDAVKTPEPFTIRLDDQTRQRLKILAAVAGVRMGDLVKRLVDAEFDRAIELI
jgi:predicted transcriptional regulator